MATKVSPDQVAVSLTGGTLTSDVFAPGGAKFLVRLRGTFVANVRLQMSRDEGSNFDDVLVFTAPDLLHLDSLPGELFRFDASGVGDYTSGTAAVFLGR